MEGQGQRGAGGAAQAAGDAPAQLLRGLAAEGEDEHALGVDAAPLDPLDHALDDRGGLAGAWTCENEERAALVGHHGTLVLIQHRRRSGPPAPSSHQPPGLSTHSTRFHQTTGVDRADLPGLPGRSAYVIEGDAGFLVTRRWLCSPAASRWDGGTGDLRPLTESEDL